MSSIWFRLQGWVQLRVFSHIAAINSRTLFSDNKHILIRILPGIASQVAVCHQRTCAFLICYCITYCVTVATCQRIHRIVCVAYTKTISFAIRFVAVLTRETSGLVMDWNSFYNSACEPGACSIADCCGHLVIHSNILRAES